MSDERWKYLDFLSKYRYYKISDHGRLKSISKVTGKERLLRQQLSHGYRTIRIHDLGGVRGFGVHILVARAFCEQEDLAHVVVDHIDRDKGDNRWFNLRWVTSSENSINTERGLMYGITRRKGGYQLQFNRKGKYMSYGCFKELAAAKQRRDEVVAQLDLEMREGARPTIG
jgi:hypothetical protein